MERFIEAQNKSYEGYEMALQEVKSGYKRTHWIWYIFPQIAGLGRSMASQYYGIKDLDEAKAYVAHPILGARLREISETLLGLETDDAYSIFGGIDTKKLRSSMTLFAVAAPECEVFAEVLEKFFDGRMDGRTLKMLGM